MPHEFSARKFLGPIYPMTDQQESLVNHILEECEKQGLTINDLSAIAVFLKEAANRASHHTKFNRFGNCQY